MTPYPKKVYRIIYADPPWQYAPWTGTKLRTVEGDYPTMPTKDICEMALPAIAKDAVLFIWATSPRLTEALKVIPAWGFTYRASFIWNKLGHMWSPFNSVRHELLLIATRGKCNPDDKRLFVSVQSVRRGRHSEKPAHFRNLIDVLYPTGNRIELFARGTLPPRWDGWGNEYVPTQICSAAALEPRGVEHRA